MESIENKTRANNRKMLETLLADHDHIRKSLNLLEIQLLDLCRGRSPDYAMMLSIVVYIQEFPERMHHPLEDTIFSLMLKHGEEAEKLARDLIADHTELEGITRELRRALESRLKDGLQGLDKLKQDLATFVHRQRRHLYAEELNMYPMISERLTAQEWQRVTAGAPVMRAPEFGERTDSDYESLAREIEGREDQGG